MAKVNATFTGTGQSAVVSGKNIQVIITGTFVGTVVPEVADSAGNFAPYGTESYTTPTATYLKMAGTSGWRLNCTAYTSGTVTYEIVSEEPFVR